MYNLQPLNHGNHNNIHFRFKIGTKKNLNMLKLK